MPKQAPILLVFLIVVGCSQSSGPTPTQVVLVTIDTLRADRLGIYGGNVATPHLDQLAREGCFFLDAIAHSPLTLPSHSSILTGTHPTYHGVKDNGRFRLPESIDTAAEILKANGYSTAAFVGGFPLHSRFGLGQGFDLYDERFEKSPATLAFAERRAEEVISAANRWMKGQTEGRYFLWIHLFDPHAPYQPPEPFRSQYSNPYDGEVAYIDYALGSLVSSLGEDVLMVVTADHGEGLGEHGESTHSLFVYESTLKVPLLFHGPGIPGGTVVEQPVGTVDILPTILDLVGLGESCASCQGESLLPRMRGEAIESGPSYAETYFPRLNLGWSELRSLRQDGWKYIQAPEPELYDLRTDPGEIKNLASDEPVKLQELAEELASFEDSTAGPGAPSLARPSQETISLLRSLGYVTAERPPPTPSEGSLPDPKSRLGVWEGFRQGMDSISKGDFDQAISEFESLLREDKGLLLAKSYLSTAYFGRGRYVEAAQQCGDLLARDPDHFEAALLLGKSFQRLGRPTEAEKALQHASELDPFSPDPLAELANLYLQAGRADEARKSLARAKERDPRAGLVLLVQGKVLILDGKTEEAEESLRAAIAADPSEEDPRVQLANLLLGQRRLEEAEKILLEGLARRPQSAHLHLGLGHRRALASQMKPAIESFKTALDLAPESILVMNSLGFAYLQTGATEKGIDLLKRSLEKKPDQPELTSLLEKLGRP